MHEYLVENFNINDLTNSFLLRHSRSVPDTERRGYFDLQPQNIDIDRVNFLIADGFSDFYEVHITQNTDALHITCTCKANSGKLCVHQAQALYNIMNNREIRSFFDIGLRHKRIREIAKDYGLENEQNPDTHFYLSYQNRIANILPVNPEIIAINPDTLRFLEKSILPTDHAQEDIAIADNENAAIIVMGRNKFYDQIFLELYRPARSKDGKIKNPFEQINVLDQVQNQKSADAIQFYSAFLRLQNQIKDKNILQEIQALKTILKYTNLPEVYAHDSSISENINAGSLNPVNLQLLPATLRLNINKKNSFFELTGWLEVENKRYQLDQLSIRFDYFVQIGKSWILIENPDFLRVIHFFVKQSQKIIIHESKFEVFRTSILARLEDSIHVTYSFLKPATKTQLADNGFDLPLSKILYLSDFGNYVELTPVMRYGNAEVPVFSKKQIYSIDVHGNPFMVKRDEEAELKFISLVVRAHEDFAEQGEMESLHIHRKTLLNPDWFPDVFETWRQEGISIYGFSKLRNNRLNQYKASVSVTVNSGLKWFEAAINLSFGKQEVTLKNLRKAVKNRANYVELGDGTQGILPSEWFNRLAKYFEAGDIKENSIHIPSINYHLLEDTFEESYFSEEAREQLKLMKEKFQAFENITESEVPTELKTELREYQKQGLNWLNFLDQFEFGGCLADDMGLGKTVQVIAFILSQRKKQRRNTNLIVAPTSLVFNWQNEINRFAPDIKILTVHGNSRIQDPMDMARYEVILTTYGTLLSDVHILRKFTFNYIVLDESQLIKNPDSLRYRAACMLSSRNKIVMTGTPLENNTMDIFGQLSFACPGLLGSKSQFLNHFLTPIDRFKDMDVADQLRKKIHPFILRRTKKQVAKELPEKTEMILYCEMGEEQRKIYKAYEKEFYNYINSRDEGDIARNQLHVLQGLTKLRQICNSPQLLGDEEDYGTSSSKIEVLMEQIEGKSGEHKILVFSQFVTMLDLIKIELEKRNIGYEYLTGQTRAREAVVNNFQENPDIRVFLISLKAGGTGLNLTQADYVYIVDPWWNPSVENQAIDRSYRIGQKKNVIAVRLVCPGTVEEKILQLQEFKKDLAEDLIKTDQDIVKSFNKKDLLLWMEAE